MFGVNSLEGLLLAGRGGGRAPGVGRVEVGDAVRVGLGLAENGPRLVLQDRLAQAHLGEDGRYAVGALCVSDPPAAPAYHLEGRAGEIRAAVDERLFAMHEFQMVTPTAAWPIHRTGPLERAPEVTGPLRRVAGRADEPQLFSRLNRPVARRAHRVTGTAEAVGVDR